MENMFFQGCLHSKATDQGHLCEKQSGSTASAVPHGGMRSNIPQHGDQGSVLSQLRTTLGQFRACMRPYWIPEGQQQPGRASDSGPKMLT